MRHSWGFPAPVLPEKEQEAYAMRDYLYAHLAEWDQSHRPARITLERTYLMRTPGGTFLIEYGETDSTFGESLGSMLTSGAPLDQWIFKTFQEITGIDFTPPLPPVGPLWEWPRAVANASA